VCALATCCKRVSTIVPNEARLSHAHSLTHSLTHSLCSPKVPKESRRTEPKRIKVLPGVGGHGSQGVDVAHNAAEPAGAPTGGGQAAQATDPAAEAGIAMT
jgi:hypothetical protein